jgi:hypothetical protein
LRPKYHQLIMKLLSSSLLFFTLLLSVNMFSQKIITSIDSPKKVEIDTLSHWVNKNRIDLTFLKLSLSIGMPVELAPFQDY